MNRSRCAPLRRTVAAFYMLTDLRCIVWSLSIRPQPLSFRWCSIRSRLSVQEDVHRPIFQLLSLCDETQCRSRNISPMVYTCVYLLISARTGLRPGCKPFSLRQELLGSEVRKSGERLLGGVEVKNLGHMSNLDFHLVDRITDWHTSTNQASS